MNKKTVLVLALTAALTSAAYAGEKGADYTIRNKDYTVKSYIRNGKIYDKDYRLEGYISRDKIYDRNYQQKSYLDRDNRGQGRGSGKRR